MIHSVDISILFSTKRFSSFLLVEFFKTFKVIVPDLVNSIPPPSHDIGAAYMFLWLCIDKRNHSQMSIELRIIKVSYSFQHITEYNSYAPHVYGDVSPKLCLESFISEELDHKSRHIYFLRAFLLRQN